MPWRRWLQELISPPRENGGREARLAEIEAARQHQRDLEARARTIRLQQELMSRPPRPPQA